MPHSSKGDRNTFTSKSLPMLPVPIMATLTLSGTERTLQIITQDRNHVIKLRIAHPRVKPDPEGGVHDRIGVGEGAGDAVVAAFDEGIEAGMLGDVAREEVARLDVRGLKVLGEVVTGEAGIGPDGHQEAEPGRIRFRTLLEEPELGNILKAFIKAGEVGLAFLDEGRELLQLGATDGRLHVGRLEVVTEMTVDVLMVVTKGQFAELLRKTATTGVVMAGFAPTIAAPITDGEGDLMEKRITHVDRATFAHRHMVGWIEAGGPNIAPGAGETAVVFGTEGVAVVLDEPKAVLLAEGGDGLEVERIPEGMGKHHGLRTGGARRLEPGRVDIGGSEFHIHEHGDGPVLDDRGDGGREPAGDGNHLVAAEDTTLLEERRSEGREREEVRGGAGIDEKAELRAQIGGEPLLEVAGPMAIGEPKLEGG